MTFSHRKLTSFAAALLASSTLVATPASSREAVIGLSPLQASDDLKAQAERVIMYLAETVEPGETALVFDALDVELIGSFSVPEGEAYANPKAKLQANRQLFAAFKHFFEGANPDADRPAAIDLPKLLRTIREHYPSDNERSIILLGSPVHDDPLAPSYSMEGGRVPYDGLVAAEANVSAYSTGGLPGSLDDDAVLFGIVPAAKGWQASLNHEYHVERFWSVSVEAHGGTMRYFGEDIETLFRLANEDGEPTAHPQPLVPTDKLEMIRFFPDKGRDAKTEAPSESAPNRTDIDWHYAENVRVRASWDCLACDLDLHVRSHPQAEVLFYGRSSTAEGQLFKDVRRGMTNGFETVVLNDAVDLAEMLIAINFYAGDATDGPVAVEIELSVGDRSFTKTVELKAQSGNGGVGRSAILERGSAPNRHWIVLSALELTKK
ncbi:hypothetical protein B7H23_03325 [Notoacmeibacter marinus]|uniref:Uncharacterized protein n=1 Tax=Notoacmeibacter marinus TaxID=1876515 RepID=A0A231V1C7_9HYPH|nr:hypothetical protein [Notoacmeibacter marinus]OXT01982.1 hypothetical protein B7H23_03325 [Notoacmeibacter marinus]